MNAKKIDSVDAALRRKTVERVRQSSALEGGRSTNAARLVQDAWADGKISYEEMGVRIRELHPTRTA